MIRYVLLVLCLIAIVGCTDDVNDGLQTSSTTPTSGTDAISVPPQLADLEVEEVTVGDRILTLAIADSPTLRSQGLMGVEDLGDLDGMLFYWRHDAGSAGFWMKDTLIPLDVVWFLEDGSFAGRASMEPCPSTADDCPTYDPGDGIDYRFAIEANPGDLDWIDTSTVIVYSD